MIYPGGGGWSQSANDLRPEANNYIVDGLTNDEPFSALSVINAPGLVGDAVTVIPIDAIQEFTTIESPKAEYGWKPGVTVSVGLKSGTNSLHGTAYAFGRSDAFDALNYFVPMTQPLRLRTIRRHRRRADHQGQALLFPWLRGPALHDYHCAAFFRSVLSFWSGTGDQRAGRRGGPCHPRNRRPLS